MAAIPQSHRDLFDKKSFAHIATVGADEHIDALAKKYTGQDRYAHRQPGEVRVTVKITPDTIQGMG